MNCPGLHCKGCNSGGGGSALGVIALILISAGIFTWIKNSMHTIDHVVNDVITFVVIAGLSIAALIVTIAVAYVTVKIRNHRRNALENVKTRTVTKPRPMAAIHNPHRSGTVFIPSETVVISRNREH